MVERVRAEDLQNKRVAELVQRGVSVVVPLDEERLRVGQVAEDRGEGLDEFQWVPR
jgi:hypothetical protein